MSAKKIGEFMGQSEISIQEALNQALQQAGDKDRIEVVETHFSKKKNEAPDYQVVVQTFPHLD